MMMMMKLQKLVFFCAVVTSALHVTQRRIGRRREGALEVLLNPQAHYKEIRRAETAWRRQWQGTAAPDTYEAAQAFRALGAIKDHERVQSLLRAVNRCEFDEETGMEKMYAAAICALSLSGSADLATKLLKHRPSKDMLAVAIAGEESPDDSDVMAALRHDTVTQRALVKMQRLGRLDLHGLDWRQAKLAIDVVLEGNLVDGWDDILIVTGRGLHSKEGKKATLRDEFLKFLALRTDLQYEEDPNAGAFTITLPTK